MSHYHKYLLAVCLALSVGGYSCRDSKGGEMAIKQQGGIQVIRFDDSLSIIVPLSRNEETDIKVRKFELAGAQLLSPPVLPFELKDSRGPIMLFPKFDPARLRPGEHYDLKIEIEYVLRGQTVIDTIKVDVVIPEEIGVMPKRYAMPSGEQRGAASGKIHVPSAEEKADKVEKDRQDKEKTRDMLNPGAKLQVATGPKGEYRYTVENKDQLAVKSIWLEITAPVKVTDTPKGWKHIEHGPGGQSIEGKGVLWMAEDGGILPGKRLGGFEIVGSTKQTNVRFTLGSGGKVAYGLTVGPKE